MVTLAATTALEKVEQIPAAFWWKAALLVAGFIAAIFVLRKVAHMNKIWLSIITFVVVVVLGFNWVYERNEPAFMTPFISKIAPFFPSKGSYSGKQQGAPKP